MHYWLINEEVRALDKSILAIQSTKLLALLAHFIIIIRVKIINNIDLLSSFFNLLQKLAKALIILFCILIACVLIVFS